MSAAPRASSEPDKLFVSRCAVIHAPTALETVCVRLDSSAPAALREEGW